VVTKEVAVTNSLDEMQSLEISGYQEADRFLATRYRQGGRFVFDIDLSLAQVVSYVPKPDPDRPTEGNRKIRVPHADLFAEYVMYNEGWVAPALLLRAPLGVLEFEVIKEISGIQWGILSIPKLARTELNIVDGQHRILGIHLAAEKIARLMDEARSHLSRARETGEVALVRSAEVKIKSLEAIRKRLGNERISLQILVIDDPVAYRQVFVDIADNALGITNAVKVRFDSRKIVNRCLMDVSDHFLLKGHVDMEQDRILGPNPNLLSAKHVSDIVRILEVGLAGRISKRQESELREAELVEQATEFFDALVAGFPDIEGVADGSLKVPQMRERSLLGSSTILRVLAGAYHDLSKKHGKSQAEITSFFAKLAPQMDTPVPAESPWIQTGAMNEGDNAPTARRQDLITMVETIVFWATTGPVFAAATPTVGGVQPNDEA
jgi:hypothetical protein